jgi:hypothetical protein
VSLLILRVEHTRPGGTRQTTPQNESGTGIVGVGVSLLILRVEHTRPGGTRQTTPQNESGTGIVGVGVSLLILRVRQVGQRHKIISEQIQRNKRMQHE